MNRVSLPNLARLGMLTLSEKVMHLGFLAKFQNKSCPIGQIELRSGFGLSMKPSEVKVSPLPSEP